MKNLKKISSFFLALVMVLSLSIPAVRAEEVTITGFAVDPVTLPDTPNEFWAPGDGTETPVFKFMTANTQVTIFYSDGTGYTNTVENLRNEGIQFMINDLPATQDWVAGTYTATVTLIGTELTADVSVTLIPDPVESITVDTVTFVKGMFNQTSSDGTVGIYQPSYEDPYVTITYTDGTVLRERLMNLPWVHNIQWRYLDNLDATNSWDVGTHHVRVRIDGRVTTIPVEIIPDPIASVSVQGGVMYAGIHERNVYSYDPNTGDITLSYAFEPLSVNSQVTINFTDGTTYTATLDDLVNAGYTVGTVNGPDTSTWAPGNTYDVTVSVNGHTCVTQYEIKANPVASVEALPITLRYSQRDWVNIYDPNTDSWYDMDGGYRLSEEAWFKVTLTDGTVHTVSYYELNHVCALLFDPQRPEAPFEAGKTYQVPYHVLGYEGTVSVTVEDDGIASITATAQYPLYETLSGYSWNLDMTTPMVTVTKNNGDSLTFSYADIEEYFPYGNYAITAQTNPENDTWTPGTYNAVLTIDGTSCTFPITVLENPVESYTVTTKYPFVENVHGYYDSYWDADDVEHVYFQYRYEFIPYTVTLHMTDGTTEVYSDLDAMAQKYRRSFIFLSMGYDETVVNGPGTYTVYTELMEMQVPQTITIVGSQVTDVTAVYNGQLVEGVSGMDFPGPHGYFYGYMPNAENYRFTVTFSDGTVQTLTHRDTVMGGTLHDLLMLNYVNTYEQTADWTVGTNKLKLTLGDIDFYVDVELVPNTIADVKVEATQPLYLGWHDFLSGGDRIFDVIDSNPRITVTFSDGTSEVFNFQQLENRFRNVFTGMLWAPVLGRNQAALYIGNEEYNFNVEVKENPIASITAKPAKSLVLGSTVNVADTEPIYTITYKDGTVKTFYGDHQILEAYGFSPEWEELRAADAVIGDNTVTLSLLGITAEYTFKIEAPARTLTGITAAATGPIYADSDPFHAPYSYHSLVQLTLHYSDGTTETVNATDLKNAYGATVVLFTDNQDTDAWNVGKHTASVYYQDFKTSVTLEVVANPYVSMAISNDNGFTVTLTKADGTKEVHIASAYQVGSHNARQSIGTLYTDKGSLDVTFTFGSSTLDVTSMTCQGLTAAGITDCQWLSSQLAVATVGDVPAVSVDKNMEQLNELTGANADRVWLTVSQVEETALTPTETQLVQEALDSLEDHEAGLVLDLSLFKQTVGEDTTKISQIPEKLTITVALPQELLDMGGLVDEIKIIRLHNGAAEILDTVYDAASGTVTFSTDRFSIYSMSYSSHKLTKVEAKDATCDAPGHTAYYTCSHCDKLFADEKAQTETTAAAVSIPAGHKLTKVEAQAATYEAAGNLEHYKCSACGDLFADANGSTATTLEAVTLAQLTKPTEETTPPTTEETVPPTTEATVPPTTEATVPPTTEATVPPTTEETVPPTTAPSTGDNPDTGDRTPVMLISILTMTLALLLTGQLALGRKRFF